MSRGIGVPPAELAQTGDGEIDHALALKSGKSDHSKPCSCDYRQGTLSRRFDPILDCAAAARDQNADVVYKTTKVIYENKPMLEAASATLKSFDPSVMVEANAVPYHPGAKRFYKEVGAWPPKKR